VIALRSDLAGQRLRLQAFVAELEDEVGPVDETEVARYGAMLAATVASADAPGATMQADLNTAVV
jgi:hypothetical protein